MQELYFRTAFLALNSYFFKNKGFFLKLYTFE
jgi:hypothetical protein